MIEKFESVSSERNSGKSYHYKELRSRISSSYYQTQHEKCLFDEKKHNQTRYPYDLNIYTHLNAHVAKEKQN